ncbi:ankyrin repeat domain-containing protein [Deinococcus hohokamensis]|uniref:Ankyrin repeat domain-containing protein n=1 Tax=Deinococcus hohokamensis TaxID=309883 RepID=A0ABV9I525_9DEIO
MTDNPRPAPATSDAVNDLFSAIHANNLPGVQLLITAEPELLQARSPSGLSPVLFAAYYRRPEILRALIGAGAPLNIYEAAAAGETAQVEALLETQPDLLHTFSPDGFSPLGLAAFFGHDEVAELLLARGADVNAVSRNAMAVQPLHSAVAGDHARLAQALVRAGAQVNAAQHGGFTALMSAAQNGNSALVAFLLSVGADPAARTAEGQDALALALESGHEAAAAQLRAAAAERQETRNAPGA